MEVTDARAVLARASARLAAEREAEAERNKEASAALIERKREADRILSERNAVRDAYLAERAERRQAWTAVMVARIQWAVEHGHDPYDLGIPGSVVSRVLGRGSRDKPSPRDQWEMLQRVEVGRR